MTLLQNQLRFKVMKSRLLLLMMLALGIVSCGPYKHIMHVDMRGPSKAGLSLENKLVSVVFLENDNKVVSEFNGRMAEGFASVLEQDLGTGEGSVGVYSMLAQPGVEYSSKDELVPLLIDTDADVVFVFEMKEPYDVKLYCYDGMDKSDQVKSFSGRTASHDNGLEAGKTVANSFKSQWRTEPYTFAYYESEKWYKALDKVEVYDWKGAIDQWITLLNTKDLMRRSCVEYNIAVACYMLGDYELAEQWLDRSDADNKLPNMSDSLRKRINSRK